MSGPEQAATVTPGQAAYDGWNGSFPGGYLPWSELDAELRDAWEAAAKAAIERKPGSERVAELVTEGNELRRRVVDAHSETRSFLARMDALARELEASAARTAPSKKSEIEAALAKRLRAITCTDPAIDPPAVVTAGTEHLVPLIRDLTIPDEL